MGDAGEGLIDADARIQERMEELERERSERRGEAVRDPETRQALESLRVARVDLERQREGTTHDRRRVQIDHAIAEVNRRMAELTARLS